MKSTMHVCRFDSTLDIPKKKRTYETVKARVLEAGRLSIFEATENPRDVWRFEQLERDPEIEVFREGMAFPWIGVRKREASK